MLIQRLRPWLVLLLLGLIVPLVGARDGCRPIPADPVEPEDPPPPVTELRGACSSTGDACTSDWDCIPAFIEGVCVTRNDWHDTHCVYDTRWDTGAEVTCEGIPFGHCDSGLDCPTGMMCGFIGSTWCDDVDADGICVFGVGGWLGNPASECVTDSDCIINAPNICQICGDGVVQASPGACRDDRCVQEQCDDGNRAAGDGCSPTCQYEGLCFDGFGHEIHELRCATVADCRREPFGRECQDGPAGPCTCRLPTPEPPAPALRGTCSSTGDVCASDADCAPALVEGTCITRDDWRDTACVYDTRYDTGAQVVCEGLAYGRCETSLDCPSTLLCGGFWINWCGVEVDGLCTYGVGGWLGHPQADCVTDADCTLNEPNICQICGDGVVQASEGPCHERCVQEQCDDGNTADGDGCSARCQMEGFCVAADGMEIREIACATAADCRREPFGLECQEPFLGPCTCRLP
jgi:cysteine-rich repeat protein